MKIENLKPLVLTCRDHAELRAQTNYKNNIVLTRGNLITNLRSSSSGVFARVYKGGTFGAASFPSLSEDSAKKALALAAENADTVSRYSGRGSHILTPVASGVCNGNIAFTEHSQEYLLDFVSALDKRVAEKYPNLSSRTLRLNEEYTRISLAVTQGYDAERILPRCHINVTFVVKDHDGYPVELSRSLGGGGLFDDYFTDPAAFDEELEDLYQKLMDKKDGVYAKAGEHDLILASDLAGILAHESIGHTVESDLIRGGSIAKNFMNQKVATDKVSLVDFAHTAFGKPVPLPIYVDDEGTKAEDVVVIENGVLKDYMTNRFDASLVGTTPKGNARAFCFEDEPLVRMRNTCILPGTDKLSDMIASVEDGYYLIKSSNGQADGTSEFMFGIVMGYEIKNGKLGRAIKDTTMSGVAFDMLKTVTMVGDSVKWSGGGMCGKKQPMQTAMGGPAIKCRARLGGR